jgi:WG containing repeat
MVYLYPIFVRVGRNRNKYKAGFIDASGKIVIAPMFDDASPFQEGLASVMFEGKWGAIDAFGKHTIPHLSSAGFRFFEGRAIFADGPMWGVLASDGNVVLNPKYDAIGDFSESLAFVRDRKQQYGFIDLSGKEVIPPFFEGAFSFSAGLAPVKVGGKWGYIDATARFVIQPAFDHAQSFVEGLACVRVNRLWGYIDRSGAFVVPPRFCGAFSFSEGLADAECQPKMRGYIDGSGKFVIPPRFVYTRPFKEGLAAVTNDEGPISHFIFPSGTTAFPGEFLGVDAFRHGLCLVSTMNTIAYIDHQGETVWEGAYVTKV